MKINILHKAVFVFFCILLLGCNNSKSDSTISIRLEDGDKFIVDNQAFPKNVCQKVVTARIEGMQKSGLQEDEIVIRLKVEPSVKMKEVSDLQLLLRELGINRINYVKTN